MSQSSRIAVVDALMMRALAINDRQAFPEELRAFDTAFQARRFRMLITDGILDEYQTESNKFPPFQQELRVTINGLNRLGRVIYFDDYRLNRTTININGLPQEHTCFVYDAIAARASHLITNRQPWLDLSPQTEASYGLQIVSPPRFVDLEG